MRGALRRRFFDPLKQGRVRHTRGHQEESRGQRIGSPAFRLLAFATAPLWASGRGAQIQSEPGPPIPQSAAWAGACAFWAARAWRARSKRSAFMTLTQAAAKSWTNFSRLSSWAYSSA